VLVLPQIIRCKSSVDCQLYCLITDTRLDEKLLDEWLMERLVVGDESVKPW